MLVSKYNSLGGGRYFDVGSSSSFAFDHATQVRALEAIGAVRSPISDGKRAESIRCAVLFLRLAARRTNARTARPSALTTVSYHPALDPPSSKPSPPTPPSTIPPPPTPSPRPPPTPSSPSFWSRTNTRPPPSGTASPRAPSSHTPKDTPTHPSSARRNDNKNHTLTPATPRNGRWRTTYLYTPATGALAGTIAVDVHYYEDGNVRLTTRKELELSGDGGGAADVIRQIALAERKYQEELNRGFAALSEGAFKGLRRQLPVTRQKVGFEILLCPCKAGVESLDCESV